MTKEQFIEVYGEAIFEDFSRFMAGQTVKQLPDGSIYFYKQDIENYFAADRDRFFD